ncbi:MAG TPA: extracellular solute-binding protein [Candidatus Limnocylindrales bacterium]|jgi:spermidine/putrescine transport system substrate-binding protein|nr:extracellular solute-binding protein [Candidatus Limnocylindrales bacterium]
MPDDRTPLPGELSRRRFLQGTALAGTAAFLASCGTPGTASQAASPTAPASASAAASASPSAAATPANSGVLRFANWIGYIDIADDGSFPTIKKFEDESGIKVTYADGEVDDNETFFTSDLQAPLDAGLATEWDIVVVTDWMVARLVRLGWLETIDTALTPNFVANLAENYKARSFDPDTNLAAPWQSGMTGIGFDKKKTGDLDSIDVFFSDKYKGKLTYLSEMRDTIGLSAIRLGSDPASLTQEQFDAALAEVDKAVKSGVVRQVTGNSYVEDMAGGSVILSMAWSGDVLTLLVPDQKPTQDFQWALPKEGGMLWTDNMVIPKGSPNKAQAERWIDFYYEPVNAATIEAYVNYVCPVAGAKEEMLKLDPEIANNPLIFPPDDYVARLHQFRATTADEEKAWAEAFTKAMGL